MIVRAALAATILATTARGVPAAEEPRFEAFVFGGGSLLNITDAVDEMCGGVPCPTFHLRTRFDTSALAGVTVGYALGPRTRAELSFSAAPWHRYGLRAEAEFFVIPIVVERDIASHHIDATLRYGLRATGRGPFVAGGLGRILYDARDDLRLRSPAGDWALVLGAGWSFEPATRLRARVEVIDHVIADHFVGHDVTHDLHVRVGVGLAF